MNDKLTTNVRDVKICGHWTIVEVAQEGLQCDACRKWFHMYCEGRGDDSKRIQEDLRYVHLNSVMWFCQWCKMNLLNMGGKNTELQEPGGKQETQG